jgi:preprotein translocase subunit YajC
VTALVNLLPFLVIVAFYLLVIRPGRARARAQLALQASLAVGQEVMTTSGLIATVTGVEDDVVLLEAAPGVTMRWAKPAVARVVSPTAVRSE